MKRILAIILMCALALTILAACGDSRTPGGSGTAPGATATPADTPADTSASTPDNGSSGDNSGNGGNGDNNGGSGNGGGQAMAALIRWMMDGTYSYDFTMISEGPEGKTEGSGSWAQDKNNFSIRQEVTVDGQKQKSWIMQKDDKIYMIDEESQFIMEMPAGMDMTEGMVTEFGGIELAGTGTGEVDGKTLPYEEYRDTAMGSTVKFYLDGDDVYAFESEYDGYKSTMIIKNASGSVPAGAFDLPEGYMNMDDIYGGLFPGGFMP